RGNIAQWLQEAVVVEPPDPLEGSELHVFQAPPRPPLPNYLRLEESDHRLRPRFAMLTSCRRATTVYRGPASACACRASVVPPRQDPARHAPAAKPAGVPHCDVSRIPADVAYARVSRVAPDVPVATLSLAQDSPAMRGHPCGDHGATGADTERRFSEETA